MSSPSSRDYRPLGLGAGRPRASSRAASVAISGTRSTSDNVYSSAAPSGSTTSSGGPGLLSSSAPRSSSMSVAFQPRIVRGTVTSATGSPGPASGNNASRSGADRRRRGSASAAMLGVGSGPYGASGSNSSSSAGGMHASSSSNTSPSTARYGHGHSMSLGSTSMLHQHLKASSSASGAPSSTQHHAYGHHHPGGPTGYGGEGSGPSSDIISFPRPAYVEQSALRRFVQVTPYSYTPAPAAGPGGWHPYRHNTDSSSSGAAMGGSSSMGMGRRPSASASRPSFSSASHPFFHSSSMSQSASGPTFLQSSIYGPGSGAGGGATGIPIRHAATTEYTDESESSDEDDVMAHIHGMPSPQAYRRRSSAATLHHHTTSAPAPTPNPPYAGYASVGGDDTFQLPTRWNEDDRSSQVNISPDGRDVQFAGVVSSGERDAAAVRANYPMPKVCGIYYFEIEILNRGQKGEIGLGFGMSSVSLQRLPGWAQSPPRGERVRESWGYHGDDGDSFASKDQGERYGPKFTTGDVVGCGVDFSMGRAFYTKNGAFIGHVFDGINEIGAELYPMVGLRTAGEAIRANFGHQPFRFDIDSHVHLQRNNVWGTIQSTPISWNSSSATFESVRAQSQSEGSPPTPSATLAVETETREAMEKVIMDYLNHHGYAGTAEAFRLGRAARSTSAAALALASSTSSAPGSALSPSPPTPSDSRVLALSSSADILARQRITASLLSGDIDEVLEVMSDRYPEALTADGGWLSFRLRCRKFVELVLEAAAAQKIAKKVMAAAVEAQVQARSDKGKGPSGVPMPLRLSTMPMAMPMRKPYPKGNGRPAAMFEEEQVLRDDDAMDVDMDFDMDGIPSFPAASNGMQEDGERSPEEHFLLHSPPSPSPFALSRGFAMEPPPAPSAMTVTSPISLSKTLSPGFMSRPLLPISTSSSSPSESPAPSSPIGSTLPLNSLIDFTSSNGNGNGTSTDFTSSSLSDIATLSTPSAPKITRAPIFPALPSPPQPRGLITAPPTNGTTQPSHPDFAASPATDGPSASSSSSANIPPPTPSSEPARAAFEHALAYGRQLDADYGADERPHVQALFHRTTSLVAYEDPLEVGGDVSRFVGQEARVELAKAVNEGILASQGRHAKPLLERMYEQTTSVVVQLGLSGHGAAAFADVEREMLRDD